MKMKKITLALAGLTAVAAFAPEASALPLFARQTGMACSACHFQHFPMLNSFGRSFKASGYTLMGAQEKVEGDDLSIPGTLNMAVLATTGYSKNNGATTPAAAAVKGARLGSDGQVYVPGTNGEFSLFIGGKVSDFAGALAEIGLTQAAGVGAGVASAKLPLLWAVGDGAHVGVVPFTTDGQGASYGYEVLNTGANAVHTMMFVGGDFTGWVAPALSAQQYIGTATPATGAAFVATNSMGFINVTKFHQVGSTNVGGAGGGALGSTYLRVAATFDLAGFDSAVGLQSWSGSSLSAAALTTAGAGTAINAATLASQATKATAIDGQMQGELGGMPVGFYASYATAPKSENGLVNTYNASTTDSKHALNISAELGVIPEKATVGFGYRSGKNGLAANNGDNAFLLEGSYKLAQNMLVNLTWVKNSGSAWTNTGGVGIGNTETILNLATIF